MLWHSLSMVEPVLGIPPGRNQIQSLHPRVLVYSGTPAFSVQTLDYFILEDRGHTFFEAQALQNHRVKAVLFIPCDVCILPTTPCGPSKNLLRIGMAQTLVYTGRYPGVVSLLLLGSPQL